jgi:hypothetical protein
LKVLVFEQTAEVLERRLGFRVAEYGLRQVFPRVPDHPALTGLEPEHLRDWRGEATLLSSRLKYELNPKFNGAPTVNWCGLPVPRAWRCGGQGSVASVLVEKPAGGDFLPIVDGGFSLQYSPLLEYREGRGMVLFCQLDVSGRSEVEPVADALVANLIAWASAWEPPPRRQACYVGDSAGRAHLTAAGWPLAPYSAAVLEPGTRTTLVVGPGGGSVLGADRERVATFLEAGGRLLGLGLEQRDLESVLPFAVTVRPVEHINASFDPPRHGSPLAGLGPADVHNRAPRMLPLVTGGAQSVGNGVLAVTPNGAAVLCQIVPWTFDYRTNYGVKRTFRRTSALVSRLLGNLGVSGTTPLLARWSQPPGDGEPGRWLTGLYLDAPEEWDDPYRFFRW